VLSNLLVPRAGALPTLFDDATLDLNFAQTKSIGDLVTFSRASTGTYVGSDGLIKTSPVNLVTYSEQFDQWTVGLNTTVSPNVAVAPDGTQTADRLQNGSQSSTFIGNGTINNGVTYTVSVYAKAVTPGTNDKFTLNVGGDTANSSSQFTTTSEWQRFVFTRTVSSVSPTPYFFINNEGDGFASDIYIWGAQLEEGTTATDYIPTTSTIGGAPRFDHDPVTGESLGLLIEEARTNFSKYSRRFDVISGDSWVPGGAAAVAGSTTTAPDGTSAGIYMADTITGATGTAFNTSVVKQVYTVPNNANSKYTFSVYIKLLTATQASIYIRDGATGGVSSASVENTSDWQRVVVTSSANLTNATPHAFYIGNTDGDIAVWGSQIEKGAFSSSYITTDTSTVTRAADVASIEGNKFAKTNLLEYSERFDQSAWAKSGSFASSQVTNAALAPDGTQTAEEYQNLATGSNNVQQLFSTSAQPYVFSIYLKAKTASDVGKSVLIGGHVSATTHLREAVQLPAEWTRFTKAGTPTAAAWVWGVDGRTSGTFSGINVTREESSFYIWGAQLEEGSELTKYTPSVESFVSRASTATYVDDATGLITTAAIDAARYENGELLLEEARTNLLTYSEELDDLSWSGFRRTVTANSLAAPDGTQTADLATSTESNFNGTAINKSFSEIATTYTFSVFAKAGNSSTLLLRPTNGTVFTQRAEAWFNLSAGTAGTVGDDGSVFTNASSQIVSQGNGWFRCSLTFTVASVGFTASARLYVVDSDADLDVTNGASLYLWGAQLEEGSFPTSYIPTNSSTVTRAADVSTSALGVDSFYNQSEGTVFAEASGEGARIVGINDGTSSNRHEIFLSPGNVSCYQVRAGINEVNIPKPKESKSSFAYKTNDYSFTSGGSSVVTDTSATPPTVDQMNIGCWFDDTAQLNGHISRLAYFSTRKSDQDLIKITDGTLAPAIITYGITSAGGTFNLRSTGTVDYAVDWDSTGGYEESTLNTLPHTYTAGDYSLVVYSDGVYRPYFNNVTADANQITSVAIGSGADLGTNLTSAWYGANSMTSFVCPFDVTSSVTSFSLTWRNCSSLTSFPLLDTSSGTSFPYAWYNCSSLTSFPLLDTSSGTSFSLTWRNCSSLTSFPLLDTSSGTSFPYAWYNCSSLTSFPLLDTSSGTSFSQTWYNCSSLTSFPLLNTSSGTSFASTWQNCTSLTSFPLLDVSSGTNFSFSWRDCSSLASFPANMFDTTGTLIATAFNGTWLNCALTAQSVENILTSLDTNGATGVTLGINGGTNAGKTTWSTAAVTAYDNLIVKGWTISFNA
jgi:hypothetical protein